MFRIGALCLTLLFVVACAGDIYRVERPPEGDGADDGHLCDDEAAPADSPSDDGGGTPADPDVEPAQVGGGGGVPGGDPGIAPGGGGPADDPGFLAEPLDYDRYVNEVNLLLTVSCGGCHSANAGPGGYSLSSDTNDVAQRSNYVATVDRCNADAPAASLVLTKGLGVAHGGGATWPSVEDCRYRITAAWIDGAEQPAGCEGFLP